MDLLNSFMELHNPIMALHKSSVELHKYALLRIIVELDYGNEAP